MEKYQAKKQIKQIRKSSSTINGDYSVEVVLNAANSEYLNMLKSAKSEYIDDMKEYILSGVKSILGEEVPTYEVKNGEPGVFTSVIKERIRIRDIISVVKSTDDISKRLYLPQDMDFKIMANLDDVLTEVSFIEQFKTDNADAQPTFYDYKLAKIGQIQKPILDAENFYDSIITELGAVADFADSETSKAMQQIESAFKGTDNNALITAYGKDLVELFEKDTNIPAFALALQQVYNPEIKFTKLGALSQNIFNIKKVVATREALPEGLKSIFDGLYGIKVTTDATAGETAVQPGETKFIGAIEIMQKSADKIAFAQNVDFEGVATEVADTIKEIAETTQELLLQNPEVSKLIRKENNTEMELVANDYVNANGTFADVLASTMTTVGAEFDEKVNEQLAKHYSGITTGLKKDLCAGMFTQKEIEDFVNNAAGQPTEHNVNFNGYTLTDDSKTQISSVYTRIFMLEQSKNEASLNGLTKKVEVFDSEIFRLKTVADLLMYDEKLNAQVHYATQAVNGVKYKSIAQTEAVHKARGEAIIDKAQQDRDILEKSKFDRMIDFLEKEVKTRLESSAVTESVKQDHLNKIQEIKNKYYGTQDSKGIIETIQTGFTEKSGYDDKKVLNNLKTDIYGIIEEVAGSVRIASGFNNSEAEITKAKKAASDAVKKVMKGIEEANDDASKQIEKVVEDKQKAVVKNNKEFEQNAITIKIREEALQFRYLSLVANGLSNNLETEKKLLQEMKAFGGKHDESAAYKFLAARIEQREKDINALKIATVEQPSKKHKDGHVEETLLELQKSLKKNGVEFIENPNTNAEQKFLLMTPELKQEIEKLVVSPENKTQIMATLRATGVTIDEFALAYENAYVKNYKATHQGNNPEPILLKAALQDYKTDYNGEKVVEAEQKMSSEQVIVDTFDLIQDKIDDIIVYRTFLGGLNSEEAKENAIKFYSSIGDDKTVETIKTANEDELKIIIGGTKTELTKACSSLEGDLKSMGVSEKSYAPAYAESLAQFASGCGDTMSPERIEQAKQLAEKAFERTPKKDENLTEEEVKELEKAEKEEQSKGGIKSEYSKEGCERASKRLGKMIGKLQIQVIKGQAEAVNKQLEASRIALEASERARANAKPEPKEITPEAADKAFKAIFTVMHGQFREELKGKEITGGILVDLMNNLGTTPFDFEGKDKITVEDALKNLSTVYGVDMNRQMNVVATQMTNIINGRDKEGEKLYGRSGAYQIDGGEIKEGTTTFGLENLTPPPTNPDGSPAFETPETTIAREKANALKRKRNTYSVRNLILAIYSKGLYEKEIIDEMVKQLASEITTDMTPEQILEKAKTKQYELAGKAKRTVEEMTTEKIGDVKEAANKANRKEIIPRT